MNPDRPFNLTPASEKTTKGKMSFNGIGGHLSHFNENGDRFIWLFIQQVVEPLEIPVTEIEVSFAFPAPGSTPG